MPSSVIRRVTLRVPPAAIPGLPQSYRPNDVLISPLSWCAVGDELTGAGASNFASATYPSANRALAYPFEIADYLTVVKVWWLNGTTATTDSADVAVYDEGGARLVSGGGTAIATANVVQEVDVTDTLLPPGRYWCAYAQNGVTATPSMSAAAAALTRAMGYAQMASAYVLPATFTPAAVAAANVPYCGIAGRTQVA